MPTCQAARQPSLFSQANRSSPAAPSLDTQPAEAEAQGAGSGEFEAGASEENVAVARAPVEEWPEQARPLGKLRAGGPPRMSNAELLALLIPGGTRDEGTGQLLTRLDLARSLLLERGSLERVLKGSPQELAKHEGISARVAGAIRGAGALTGRLEAEQAGKECLKVGCPEDVAAAYGPDMRDLDQEIFRVLALSTANTVTGEEILSRGGLAASIVEVRAVCKFALSHNAAAIVALHNHPSGNPEPSREDVKVTGEVQDGLDTLNIPLHDHLIIAGRSYTSLAERGVL